MSAHVHVHAHAHMYVHTYLCMFSYVHTCRHKVHWRALLDHHCPISEGTLPQEEGQWEGLTKQDLKDECAKLINTNCSHQQVKPVCGVVCNSVGMLYATVWHVVCDCVACCSVIHNSARCVAVLYVIMLPIVYSMVT